MKRMLALLLTAALSISLVLPARAAGESGFIPDAAITAKAVYLYNMDTGKVIYEKNAHEPLPPASLTKLMTAVLALESTKDPEGDIVAFPPYVEDYLYRYQREHGGISLAGLRAKDEITMRDALHALLLPSANEVAMSIADHISGSQEDFALAMNKRAKELGCLNTSFVNANGLYDPQHLSTAYDMAQIAMHAMKLPKFMDIVTTQTYTGHIINKDTDVVWQSTNKMQLPTSSYYYPYSKGVKTGMVPEIGYNFVSTASKDGFTYLLVVIGCGEYVDGKLNTQREMHFVDSAKLYGWVFDTFRVKSLLEKGKTVHGVPLRLSLEQDQVKLMAGERFTALLPKDIEPSDVSFEMHVPGEFTAPVKKGDPAGEVSLILSGEEVGRVPLVFAESVEASPALVLLEKVKEVTRTFWFKFAVVFLALLIVLYIVLMVIRNRNRRRSGYRPRRRL